jgi:transaldolase
VELWKIVDRPNVLIKIPATEAGIPAIAKTIAEGISVNVTLIFSVERYELVMGAFIDGLEQASKAGHDLSKIHSVASFFVSRVDSEIDKRLDAIGTDEAKELKGKAALANARLAYAAYQEVFEKDERFTALASAGAHAQRPLWASTGVKDPAYPDTLYVGELVAPGTVNTMPEKTMDAFADHGEVNTESIIGQGPASQEIFDKLSAVGIDITDVFLVLENEGVEKFEASWKELLDATAEQLAEKSKG